MTKVAGEITVRREGYQSFSELEDEVRDRANTLKDQNRDHNRNDKYQSLIENQPRFGQAEEKLSKTPRASSARRISK